MFRKISAGILALILVLSMTACTGDPRGQGQNTSFDPTTSHVSEEESSQEESEDSENESESDLPDSSQEESSQEESQGENSSPEENQEGTMSQEEIEERLSSMTLEQKIAQMMMIDFRTWYNDSGYYDNVTELNEEQIRFIQETGIGGICLFSENCEGTEQLVRLTDQIQQAALSSENRIPMLISIDQEGGYIVRLQTGTSMIGNMAIAATGDPENAAIAASVIAEELSALGINVNLAPDADVNSNPSNPIIGIRSFSDDPAVVAQYASPYIRGLHEYNVAATMKHFPGHGDTAVDSHTGLPLIEKSYPDLLDLELLPFAILKEETDLIMTAHIQFPQVEGTTYTSITTGEEVYLPATLSKAIISDILRKDLGYEGIVITDSMQMDAIKEHFGVLDAIRMAINADVDILLMPMEIDGPFSMQNAREMIVAIADMVERGDIDEKQINDSVERILKLKAKLGLIESEKSSNANDSETSEKAEKTFLEMTLEEKIDHALQVVGSEEHHRKEWQLAVDAVTVVKDEQGLLPLTPEDGTNVLVLAPWDSEVSAVWYAKRKMVNEGSLSDAYDFTGYCFNGFNGDYFNNSIQNCDILILVTRFENVDELDASNWDNYRANFYTRAIEIAREYGKKVVTISVHMPYDVYTFDSDISICCYNPNGYFAENYEFEYDGEVPTFGPNLAAAVYVAFGGAEGKGILPVKIPDLSEE